MVFQPGLQRRRIPEPIRSRPWSRRGLGLRKMLRLDRDEGRKWSGHAAKHGKHYRQSEQFVSGPG